MKISGFVLGLSIVVLSEGAAGAQSREIDEPLLPTDGKQCAAMGNEFQSAIRAADLENDRCRRNLLGRPSVGHQTNAACLAHLPDLVISIFTTRFDEYLTESGRNGSWDNRRSPSTSRGH